MAWPEEPSSFVSLLEIQFVSAKNIHPFSVKGTPLPHGVLHMVNINANTFKSWRQQEINLQ